MVHLENLTYQQQNNFIMTVRTDSEKISLQERMTISQQDDEIYKGYN